MPAAPTASSVPRHRDLVRRLKRSVAKITLALHVSAARRSFLIFFLLLLTGEQSFECQTVESV